MLPLWLSFWFLKRRFITVPGLLISDAFIGISRRGEYTSEKVCSNVVCVQYSLAVERLWVLVLNAAGGHSRRTCGLGEEVARRPEGRIRQLRLYVQ
jgi:hypothetical protein